jgi:short-subunit dehydrogenase
MDWQAAMRSRGGMFAGAIGAGLGWWGARGRGSLRGAVVAITGGSRGLGLVLARRFAERGAKVALLARDAAALDRAARDLSERGAAALPVPCDVRDRDAVERAMAVVRERLGPIDVLVNDAGIIQAGPYDSLSLEDLRDAMDANYWGTVHATWAVLPGMRARRRGRIVNVTSIGGAVAVPHLLGYTASKFAAVGFSTGLAAEAARHGVRVTTIVPGLMRTGSFLHARMKGDREKEMSAFTLAGSLPLLTLDADRAARRIVRACERGERFVTVGAPWKALRLAATLAPGLAIAAFSALSRLLPGSPPGAAAEPAEPGWKHRAGVARSAVTRLQDRAADRNNERPDAPVVH